MIYRSLELNSVTNTIFKVTVDLQGYLPENAFFTRCFRENHGKLYITVKLINCKSENKIYFAIFVLIGTRKPVNTKNDLTC